MSNKQELKSCPFCGGEEIRFVFMGGTFEDTIVNAVECKSCGIGSACNTTKEEAIQAWNTRAESKQLDEEVLIRKIVETKKHWQSEEEKSMRLNGWVKKVDINEEEVENLCYEIHSEVEKGRILSASQLLIQLLKSRG